MLEIKQIYIYINVYMKGASNYSRKETAYGVNKYLQEKDGQGYATSKILYTRRIGNDIFAS